MEQLLAQPAATQNVQDQPIPVDVYQEGGDVVIEAALPGARLDDLELSCDEGLLTLRAQVAQANRDYAVREIARGTFSRTIALPDGCQVDDAKASYQDGIVRIVLPRARSRSTRTIPVEVSASPGGGKSQIVMGSGPDVVDAVKGEDYREVETKPRSRKRSK